MSKLEDFEKTEAGAVSENDLTSLSDNHSNCCNDQSPVPDFSPRRDVINVFDAVINQITTDRGTTFVTISYRSCPTCKEPESIVTLIVNQNTVIRNERGSSIRAGELQAGMVINTSFSAAMTRSIPPQAQAFLIVIVKRPKSTQTTVGRIIEVNTSNDFILTININNPASAIRFNISPETVILDPFGRRIHLSRLRPGLRVRVEHAAFMTASIPPQTTAFTIQIIR